MSEQWKVFIDRNTGRELCAYTLRGTFPGEEEQTKGIIAAENNIRQEDIITRIEKRGQK